MSTVFSDEENIAWAKSLPAKLCSACLIIQSEGHVLMVKANYKDHWTFPGGIVDEHESPQAAALRETHEEVGLAVETCEPFSIVYTGASNGYPDRFSFAFKTDIPTRTGLAELSIPNDEIDEARWVPITEVAATANNRGSYQVFQAQLQNPSAGVHYTEAEHYNGS